MDECLAKVLINTSEVSKYSYYKRILEFQVLVSCTLNGTSGCIQVNRHTRTFSVNANSTLRQSLLLGQLPPQAP